MRRRSTLVLLFIPLFAAGLFAQAVLFFENFDNTCSLPAGWETNFLGNPNPVWYVSDSLYNDDENGLSMNGSCFLVIDDDATGDNTPSYVADFISPPFDASQFSTISLSVDVHYRDYEPAAESFQVLITDGVTETLLRSFSQGQSTGDSLFEYVSLKYDLSFYTASPNTRLIFRYDDGGGFGWWAAIDNIAVVGSGAGQNVVKETFNDCAKPTDWETEIVTGVDDWIFGYQTNPSTTWASTSMDGSCMAYFDDDILGDSAPVSNIRLKSPWFDGTEFGRFDLAFDIIMRYYSEKVAIIVEHGDGSEHLVIEAAYDIGGPHYNNYVHAMLDLSAFRSQQMRVIFEYDDGQDWGWWIGLDNVKITGSGEANDLCSTAKPLLTGTNCVPSNNFTALFDGPVPTCIQKPVAGMWFSWQADFTGTAKLSTGANFNDVVNVFTGDCANPAELLCDNHDEHGFTGESTLFPVQNGINYFFRVCGKEAGYGVSRGEMCLKIDQVTVLPTIPNNDHCSTATPLVLGVPCLAGTNVNATTSATIPSLNELARADIWYNFTAPTLAQNEVLEFSSNADFSEIMTIYSGDCSGLTEVASAHKGGALKLDNLTDGQAYFLQISGNFATVEGAVCLQMSKKLEAGPDNNDCLGATSIDIGSNCIAASNVSASFSGYTPPCVVSVDRDIWFEFVAPASGGVRINTGADFQHVLAVWEGDCNDLTNIFCQDNPKRCDGFIHLGSLSAGKTYFVQVAAQVSVAGPASGDVCVTIQNDNVAPAFMPMTFDITQLCVDVDMAKLKHTLSGGVAPFTITGNADGEILPSGSPFLTVVRDDMGCEKAISGIVAECQGNDCTVSATLAVTEASCHDSATASILVVVAGGVGPYEFLWSNGVTSAENNGIPAGNYSVTVTDALYCDQVVSVSLVNPPAIVIAPNTIVQPSTGQSDGAISVDLSGGTGVLTPNWYREGVLVGMGIEDLVAVPAGDYQLQVTDENGCMAIFDITLSETSGIKDLSTKAFAEIFPNPAKDKTTLMVSFTTPRDLYLSLTDASGRVLNTWTERNVTEQNIAVDLRMLPSGTYQLRIVTAYETMTEQIVVAK